MIGPISPVGADSVQASGLVAGGQAGSVASSSAGGVGLNSLEGAGVLGNSQAMSEVLAAVSEMLKELGGGLENDKVLQALIALIILIALIQGALEDDGSAGSLLKGAVGHQGNHPLLLESTNTSTTILIQQTTVSNVYELSAGSGVSADQGDLGTSGDSIDVTV